VTARPAATRRGSVVPGLVIALGLSVVLPVFGKEPFVAGDRPELSLPDLSGATVSSEDPRFAGKVILIDPWGIWCPPCPSEIPTFVDLQAKYGDRGLVIVGIAFEDREPADDRRAMLAGSLGGFPSAVL